MSLRNFNTMDSRYNKLINQKIIVCVISELEKQ